MSFYQSKWIDLFSRLDRVDDDVESYMGLVTALDLPINESKFEFLLEHTSLGFIEWFKTRDDDRTLPFSDKVTYGEVKEKFRDLL
jgi:hypothetical protein